jgi:hypothetical protein
MIPERQAKITKMIVNAGSISLIELILKILNIG